MSIYANQEDRDNFHLNMCRIFDTSINTVDEPINFSPIKTTPDPWNKGKSMDQAYKDAHKGYQRTPEQIQRNTEHLNEIRQTMYTKERNEKISKTLKGIPLTEERKQNISNAKKGKKYSTEQKLARSEAMRKWHLSRKERIRKD